MEVAGIALAVLPVAAELWKVGRRIYKTSQRLPLAQRELQACLFEVNGFNRTIQMTQETTERISNNQMTQTDIWNIHQIMKQAKAFSQDIHSFLRELRRALRPDRRPKSAFRQLFENRNAVRQWERFRPQLDIFKWSLFSQKASLQLMTDLFILRDLDAILRDRTLSAERRKVLEGKRMRYQVQAKRQAQEIRVFVQEHERPATKTIIPRKIMRDANATVEVLKQVMQEVQKELDLEENQDLEDESFAIMLDPTKSSSVDINSDSGSDLDSDSPPFEEPSPLGPSKDPLGPSGPQQHTTVIGIPEPDRQQSENPMPYQRVYISENGEYVHPDDSLLKVSSPRAPVVKTSDPGSSPNISEILLPSEQHPILGRSSLESQEEGRSLYSRDKPTEQLEGTCQVPNCGVCSLWIRLDQQSEIKKKVEKGNPDEALPLWSQNKDSRKREFGPHVWPVPNDFAKEPTLELMRKTRLANPNIQESEIPSIKRRVVEERGLHVVPYAGSKSTGSSNGEHITEEWSPQAVSSRSSQSSPRLSPVAIVAAKGQSLEEPRTIPSRPTARYTKAG